MIGTVLPENEFRPPMPKVLPPRPTSQLSDLAETIIEAVAAKQLADVADMCQDYDWSACQLKWQEAERRLRASFADIGISPAYLKLLKEVL